MYAILLWVTDDYVTYVHNDNGSIKLFETVNEADSYASQVDEEGEDAKVVSLL